MDGVTRYLCRVRSNGHEGVILWETGDQGPDRVVTSGPGHVVTFESEDDARRWGASSGVIVSAEAAPLYDLDAIASWCASDDRVVDCSVLLNTWNFLADVPNANDLFASANSAADAIYDKLFHGCNLPAMGGTPGEYVPRWTDAEVVSLKHLLLLGINDFRSRSRSWEAVEQGVADGPGPRLRSEPGR